MKIRKWLLQACLGAGLIGAVSAVGQSSAISYQGRLNATGTPANGRFDFTLTLFGSATGGTPLAAAVTNLNVSVTNGLFTTSADFGTSVYAGGNRWLEIAVRTNGVAGLFTTLAPRQALAAAPVAVFALAGNQGAPGANGAPGTAGQNGTTAFGTGSVSVGGTGLAIPGLTQTVVVPTNCVVFVTTDGGITTQSTTSTGYSIIQVFLQIDGVSPTAGGYAYVTVLNSAGFTGAAAQWSLSQTATLSAGSHTLAVYASNVGGSAATVSGSSASALQGELTVLFLNK